MKLRLAPSILTADFGSLAEDIARVAPYVDWFHLDVMDGHYVPNLTFGPSTVEAVRAACDLPLHVHLMISDPMTYSRPFVEAGADRISFHPEVVADPGEVVAHIKDLGAGAGIAVHPDVDLSSVQAHLGDLDVVLMMTVRPGFGGQKFMDEVLVKISEARRIVDESPHAPDIEVDGGVKLDNVQAVVDAGAEIIVSGSGIYDGSDPVAAARRLRERLDDLAKARR